MARLGWEGRRVRAGVGGGGERIGGKKQDKYRGEKKGTEEKPEIS